MNTKILVINTDKVPGKEIAEVLGLVRGNTVRARHIGSDIGAGLKGIVGGEIKGYVKVLNEARDEALSRMVSDAEALGADAILSVRFATSQIMSGAAEILAYGTAVKFK